MSFNKNFAAAATGGATAAAASVVDGTADMRGVHDALEDAVAVAGDTARASRARAASANDGAAGGAAGERAATGTAAASVVVATATATGTAAVAAGAGAEKAAAATNTPAAAGGKRNPKGARATMMAKRRRHSITRWCVQLVFLVLAPGLFSAAFNGVKYVFTQLGTLSELELTQFVTLALALFAFTILLGRFFCGFACAFGTLGDIVFAAATPLRRALKMPDRPLNPRVQRAAQKLKYVVLLALCLMCFAGAGAVISSFDPWVAFAGATTLSLAGVGVGAIVAFACVVALMALVERSFCQFLCPLGAVFSLLPQLPHTSFARKASQCPGNCGLCQKGCPVGIFPDPAEACAGECIACGKCADGCPLSNIGMARVGQGVAKTAKVKGTEIAITLVKAAALLAICAWLGQLRFL